MKKKLPIDFYVPVNNSFWRTPEGIPLSERCTDNLTFEKSIDSQFISKGPYGFVYPYCLFLTHPMDIEDFESSKCIVNQNAQEPAFFTVESPEYSYANQSYRHYKHHGKFHRQKINGIEQPSCIGPYYNYIKYYKYDKLHRSPIDGYHLPAIIQNCFDDVIVVEYYIDGVYHRPINQGPSRLIYTDINGVINKLIHEEYYELGCKKIAQEVLFYTVCVVVILGFSYHFLS